MKVLGLCAAGDHGSALGTRSRWPWYPVKRVAQFTYGDALLDADDTGDIPVFGSNGAFGRHSEPNTGSPVVLIGRKGSCGALNWSDVATFAIDTVFYVDNRSCSANLRWFYWALHEAHLGGISQDTGVPGLSRALAHATRLPVPPPSEQIAIASFLDREVGKIDRLISEQERLVALLGEKRQAVISHAVTKGLSPNARMKFSAIDWLGEVPEHWKVMPIRFAARLESGHTPSRSRPEYWENCEFPWFALSDVWQLREASADYVYETTEKVSALGLENSSARLLPKGTVLLSRTASVGFAGIMGVEMATTQDFANWVCGSNLQPEFLLFVFRSMAGEFKRLMYGSTHNTIYMPDIQAFRFALPPMAEQTAIVDHIRCETAAIDGVLFEAKHMTALLRERRSSLISAAVTGQIDVRESAPAMSA